jgi:hypothetical protein
MPNSDLLIEFSGAPPAALDMLAMEHPHDVVVMQSKGLGAPEYTTAALIALSALRLIAPIICAHIEAKQHVRFKFKGQEIELDLQGANEDKMITILEKALEDLKDVGD